MMREIEEFRLKLNNLIENYRQGYKIPAHEMTGVIAQELIRLKDSELAELYLETVEGKQNESNNN